MPDGLLEAAKNYLDITWTDTDTDTKLTGILTRGMKTINGVAGDELDYSTEDEPRELLFEYADYVRHGKLAQFITDYVSRLSALQLAVRVAADV